MQRGQQLCLRAEDRSWQIQRGIPVAEPIQLAEVCSEDAEAEYLLCDEVKFKKINREVKILMALGGKHNVVKLLDIVKEG